MYILRSDSRTYYKYTYLVIINAFDYYYYTIVIMIVHGTETTQYPIPHAVELYFT